MKSIDDHVKELRKKYKIGRIKIWLDQDGFWMCYIDWNFKGEIAYPRNAQGGDQELEKAFKSAKEDIGK